MFISNNFQRLFIASTHVPDKVDSVLTAPKILGNACQTIGETRPKQQIMRKKFKNNIIPQKHHLLALATVFQNNAFQVSTNSSTEMQDGNHSEDTIPTNIHLMFNFIFIKIVTYECLSSLLG